MALKASIAADIMTENVEVLRENDTIQTAAELLAENDVGALPICDDKNRLSGIITDRDIVVSGIARGKDPRKTTVGEIASAQVITVDPDAPVSRVIELMAQHRVRRLPVVEDGACIGMISQADIARSLPEQQSGKMLGDISS